LERKKKNAIVAITIIYYVRKLNANNKKNKKYKEKEKEGKLIIRYYSLIKSKESVRLDIIYRTCC
jgi:hypothetical protein